MKFVTNNINLSQKKSFSDIVNSVRTKEKGMSKVASTATEEVSQPTVETVIAETEVEVKVAGEGCLTPAQEKLPDAIKSSIEAKCDKSENKDEDKEEKKEDKEEKKEANTSSKFVKISKLTNEQKSMVKEYWLKQFPSEYVEAMLADRDNK